jgi:hypothetical protein
MKNITTPLEVAITRIPREQLPNNCEILARICVGDLEYGLARDPFNRTLFLLSVPGVWRLDIPLLLASFVDAERAFEVERGWVAGEPLANHYSFGRQDTLPRPVVFRRVKRPAPAASGERRRGRVSG